MGASKVATGALFGDDIPAVATGKGSPLGLSSAAVGGSLMSIGPLSGLCSSNFTFPLLLKLAAGRAGLRFLDDAGCPARRWVRFAGMVEGQHLGL
jgi:hypothetical protein